MEPLSQTPTTNTASQRASGRQPRFPYVTITIVILVIAASVGALFYFSNASVEVMPNTLSASVQSSFTASSSAGGLPFKVISAEKIASQSVKASGTKTVSSSASGTVTIYNTQSKSQQLITNTRFATSAGLIFRIHAAVTVPSGTTAVPGKVTAKVFADKAGGSYNVGPSSFTVPGFASTPQADKVYARSSTAMTGGASGSVPVVDVTTEAQTRRALKTALTADLEKSLQSQIPAGYLLITGAATTTFQELDFAPSANSGTADVKEKGIVTAVVFPNTALGKAIASSVPGLSYQGEPLTVSKTDALTLTPASHMPDAEATSFSFTLSGSAPLVYTVDTARIAAAVAGKTRSAAEVALTSYPEVSRAIIILRPFWKQTFPEDPAAIRVVVTNP